jgi:hypothetical protein
MSSAARRHVAVLPPARGVANDTLIELTDRAPAARQSPYPTPGDARPALPSQRDPSHSAKNQPPLPCERQSAQQIPARSSFLTLRGSIRGEES